MRIDKLENHPEKKELIFKYLEQITEIYKTANKDPSLDIGDMFTLINMTVGMSLDFFNFLFRHSTQHRDVAVEYYKYVQNTLNTYENDLLG